MIYGIICAMDEEIALLREDMTQATDTVIAGRHFYSGQLYGADVVLVQSQVGKVAAALTTTLLLFHFKVDRVLCSGTAGGFGELKVGDAVVADYCVQHDFKLPPAWGEEFRIPGLNISYIPATPALTTPAMEAVKHYLDHGMKADIPENYQAQFNIQNPKVVLGTIASADEFIHTEDRRVWLTEHVKNLCCAEMESAAIAQVCYEFGVDYTIVRVISDCSDSFVDFDAFIEHAARYFTRGVVQAVLKNNH